MKENIRSVVLNTAVCTLALLLPAVLAVYAFQTKRYEELSREVGALERKQDELIEQNKKLVSDISLLLSSGRIERIAAGELGMHKADSEDIVRVEMDRAKK